MRIRISLLVASFLILGMTACTPGYIKKLESQRIDKPMTQADKDRNIILDYLVANKIKAESTASGIYYVMEEEGNGNHPTVNDEVTVHYKGYLLDGTKFDSSYDRNQPATFPLRAVIQGWQEGIPLFKEGGKGTLYIPSGLAYGERGAGATIKPNSVLAFDVELLSIK